MSDQDDGSSSLVISAAMIVGGIGSFVGSSYAKDPRTQLILKAGGILSVFGGLLVGGSGLLDKLKGGDLFGSFFGHGNTAPTQGPSLPITEDEQADSGGSVDGHWIHPSENQIVDVSTLGSSIDISATISNPTSSSKRVHVSAVGTENYTISADEDTGVDLGEITIGAGKSMQVHGVYVLGATVLLPFSSASVTLKLLIDGVEVDRLHFSYE
jgi:hypothetical protein